MAPWQNCGVTRARTGTQEGPGGGSSAGWSAAYLGVPALSLLLLTVGCAADTDAAAPGTRGTGASDPVASVPAPGVPEAGNPVASAPALSGTAPTATAASEPTSGQASATARATLEDALRGALDDGKPSTEQLRGALVAAGFSAADVQVTAGRTPTGQEADAVEVGVNQGGGCLVAQVRGGAVSVTVLPVLADGRCLVGAAGP